MTRAKRDDRRTPRGSARSTRSRRPELTRGRPKSGPATAARSRSRTTVRARVAEGVRSKRLAGAARALGLSSTRRAAIAALVVCALAFTLAVPLRTYLAQRAEVAEQEELKEQLTGKVAELERKKRALSDPAQIEAEARRRLRYVMPGETPYIVQLPGDAPTGENTPPVAGPRSTRPGSRSCGRVCRSEATGERYPRRR